MNVHDMWAADAASRALGMTLEVVGDGEARDLVAGVYDGLIYLKNPALPLANLRVVVEGPPPAV